MKENKTYQVCHEQKCHRYAVVKNDIDKLRTSAVNLHSVLERQTTSKVTVFGGRQSHLTPFSLICCMVILKRVLSENTHKHMNISDILKGLGSITGRISKVSSVTKKLAFFTNVMLSYSICLRTGTRVGNLAYTGCCGLGSSWILSVFQGTCSVLQSFLIASLTLKVTLNITVLPPATICRLFIQL